MKKCLPIGLIAIIILVLSLSGCGGGHGSEEPTQAIVHYDNDPSTSFGGATRTDAILVYFNTAKLQPYAGYKLVGVRINYFNYAGNPDSFNFKTLVFTGMTTAGQPDTLRFSQDKIFNKGWNDVMLAAPIPITSGMVIWAGYEVNVSTCWPITIDAGPIESGVNFMKSSTDPNYRASVYSGNFNIRLIIEKD